MFFNDTREILSIKLELNSNQIEIKRNMKKGNVVMNKKIYETGKEKLSKIIVLFVTALISLPTRFLLLQILKSHLNMVHLEAE